MYGKGISREGSIIDVGTEFGIIEKSGSWYSYKEERIGQGRENAKVFLMQNEKIGKRSKNAVKEKLGFAKEEPKAKSRKKSENKEKQKNRQLY